METFFSLEGREVESGMCCVVCVCVGVDAGGWVEGEGGGKKRGEGASERVQVRPVVSCFVDCLHPSQHREQDVDVGQGSSSSNSSGSNRRQASVV